MLARRTSTNLLAVAAITIAVVAGIALIGVFSRQIGLTVAPGDTGAGGTGRAPQVNVTVTGTVGSQNNTDGETEYTLTTPNGTLRLDAGPAWFFGGAYPLAPFVGRQVTIGGEQRQGSTEVDVLTVDGTALREPGKPPWAGGWKRVGERHPGWSQEKADREAAKVAGKKERFGVDCWPPGHCKDASGKPQTPTSTSTP
jgi:hypothetical protein